MSHDYDVVIIGGGPAGLAAAVYAGRALMSTLILESSVVGGQIAEAYDVDNYPGFSEGITGADLAEQMLEHAQRFDAELERVECQGLHLDGAMKRVVTDEAEYRTPIVIIASGASHRKLGIPGEKELSGQGVSYCATCDGPFFRDKKLIVVGGGDAATTEGVFLTRFASQIKLVHRREGFRARPVNEKAVRENEKIELVLDTVVTEIHGDDLVEGVTMKNVKTEKEYREDCDGVFIFIGHDPNTAYLEPVLPRYAGDVIPVDLNMETEIKGMYAVGDVRKGSYRQVGTGVGEGITAAMHAEHRFKQLVE